jgi:hypothetical protein
MKSLRTVRNEPRAAEPLCDPSPAKRAAGASAGAISAPGGGRRDSRSSLPGPSAGWRLPSGQLLVEYALQTCFTGSPFDRTPFHADKDLAAQARPDVPAGEETLVTQGVHRLQSAINRESAEAASPASKRAAESRPGKERTRS